MNGSNHHQNTSESKNLEAHPFPFYKSLPVTIAEEWGGATVTIVTVLEKVMMLRVHSETGLRINNKDDAFGVKRLSLTTQRGTHVHAGRGDRPQDPLWTSYVRDTNPRRRSHRSPILSLSLLPLFLQSAFFPFPFPCLSSLLMSGSDSRQRDGIG